MIILLSLFSSLTFANPDFSRGVEILSPRFNVYELPQDQFQQKVMAGKKHAVNYPVTVTQMLLPYRAINYFFNIFGNAVNFTEMEQWLGLHPFPADNAVGIYKIPNPNADKNLYMGTTVMKRFGAEGFTFSCAGCHSANLFGKSVLGLTNRFPRANEYFVLGKKAAKLMNYDLFRFATNASPEEMHLLKDSMENIVHIESITPVTLGLDTSLASVALSLSHRIQDEYATKDYVQAMHPRDNQLRSVPADSKPLPWWNVKYKNRFLADGSVVSGNPVFTNFLWNEIGRGTDLHELEKWIDNNEETIQELTSLVFATEAPKYTDFFSVSKINIESAKNGERVYLASCKGCHGVYEKNWETGIQTTQVHYPKLTKVIDVGTDAKRYEGINFFADDLNRLSLMKKMGTVVEPQKGYVPPPLVGIWARWPYFHNNSIPNLCALLTESSQRPKSYYSGEAIDPDVDFDQECNGYPIGDKTPKHWKKKEHFFDTTKIGMSNSGHNKGIDLSSQEKKDLIMFLKTL